MNFKAMNSIDQFFSPIGFEYVVSCNILPLSFLCQQTKFFISFDNVEPLQFHVSNNSQPIVTFSSKSAFDFKHPEIGEAWLFLYNVFKLA